MLLSTALPTACGVAVFEDRTGGAKHMCVLTYTSDSIDSGAFHAKAVSLIV